MYQAMSDYLPGLFNVLVLLLSSCATQFIMCCQITHGTGGKNYHSWCLILGPLTIYGMGVVQDRLWSSPLVPIWVSMSSLPKVGLLGRRLGILRCGIL